MKPKKIDDLLCEFREDLEKFSAQHDAIVHEAAAASQDIVDLYKTIWEPEQMIIEEMDRVRDGIQVADFLLHKPR